MTANSPGNPAPYSVSPATTMGAPCGVFCHEPQDLPSDGHEAEATVITESARI
jgi:hypothetical protein